jgi:hypothetical protein
MTGSTRQLELWGAIAGATCMTFAGRSKSNIASMADASSKVLIFVTSL